MMSALHHHFVIAGDSEAPNSFSVFARIVRVCSALVKGSLYLHTLIL